MSTKLTFIGAAPAVTTGEDVVNAGPQTPTVADQNIANLRGAVDDKMPLTGTSEAVSFGAVTASGITAIKSSNMTFNNDGNLQIHTTDSNAVDVGGQLSLYGPYSGTATTVMASVAGRRENGDNADISGYLQLTTSQSGVGPIERMRITSMGNVLIGTTTVLGDGTAKLQVAGSGYFVGGITASALPVYADNTAAAALAAGTMYRTSAGTVMIKY